MNRTHARLTVLALGVLTGCAGLIGVPDLTFDENAEAGQNNPDGQASSSSGDVITSGDGPNGGDTTVPTCNADLKVDKANCGACGHDCSQGICADGICTLMETTYGAQAIAIQGSTLYFGFLGDSNPAGIVSCPTIGCASATVAAKPLLPPAQSVTIENLAVNATHLYASNYYTPGDPIRIDNADGGVFPMPHTAGNRTYGVALDPTTLYFTENESTGGVFYCALPNCTGGAKKIVDSSNPEIVIVAQDGAVIFADENGYTITKCASKTNCTGAGKVEVPNHAGDYINDFKIDNNVLFWAGRYEVLSCALNPLCANPTTIVPEVVNDVITTIAVSGTTLYWGVLTFNPDAGKYNDDDGFVKKCEIANCAATTKILASKQKGPAAMVLDDKSLYWVNNGHRNYVDGKGSVVKVPR